MSLLEQGVFPFLDLTRCTFRKHREHGKWELYDFRKQCGTPTQTRRKKCVLC